jgi:hypothetical protein
MKISVQEKIAELETRIEKLEKRQGRVEVKNFDERTRGHWKKMWSEFDEVMKELFR